MSKKNRIATFLGTIATIVVIWGFVLPTIAKSPWVKEREQFLDAHKIDPSAMFYTDLEVVSDVLERVE